MAVSSFFSMTSRIVSLVCKMDSLLPQCLGDKCWFALDRKLVGRWQLSENADSTGKMK